MDERVRELELAVGSIKATVVELEARVAALEFVDAPVRREAGEEAGGGADAAAESQLDTQIAAVMGTPTLIGRSLLVLAGAFLLRVLTERGTLAPALGVGLGMAYAMAWIVIAASAAHRGLRTSAGFHAVCSALIAGPLLFEAATSFGVLSPPSSALALAGVTAAGLGVSVRWRLRWTAWVFTLAYLITAAAVATVHSPGEAATVVVVALGLATLWFGSRFRWTALMWLGAGAADLAVLGLTEISVAGRTLPPDLGWPHPAVVVAIQAVLIVGYVGTFVVGSLRGREQPGVFEFAQTVVVWVVGWGGAVRLATAEGWSITGLAVVALAAGVAAFTGAFGVVGRRQGGGGGAFIYLSSLGLGLVLVGLPGVAGGAAPVVWAILAAVLAAMGARWNRLTLRVHAAVLVVVSWFAAGLFATILFDLGGAGTPGVAPRAEAVAVVLLTVLATSIVVAGRRRRTDVWFQRLPRAGLLFLTAMVGAAAMVEAAVVVLPQGAAPAGGTVALSVVAVGLAVLVKRWHVVEAGWLVYPLLLLAGVRLVARDFLAGQTLVLVIALAAYGFALIAATRMVGSGLRSAGREPTASA